MFIAINIYYCTFPLARHILVQRLAGRDDLCALLPLPLGRERLQLPAVVAGLAPGDGGGLGVAGVQGSLGQPGVPEGGVGVQPVKLQRISLRMAAQHATRLEFVVSEWIIKVIADVPKFKGVKLANCVVLENAILKQI